MDSKAASSHSCDQWVAKAFKAVVEFIDANKILIAIILIIACFRHGGSIAGYRHAAEPGICAHHSLVRFREARDLNGMRRIAGECRSDRLSAEAAHILQYWDNEDWRRARNARTVQAFRHYLRRWEYDGAHVAAANKAIRYLVSRGRLNTTAVSSLNYCSRSGSSPRNEFFVQVFTSKRLGRAAFVRDSIARKYSDVIGNCEADVRSVRLRGAGETHRVVIGPVQTRPTAQMLCKQLKRKGLAECVAIQ
jgi:hypothetical protein